MAKQTNIGKSTGQNLNKRISDQLDASSAAIFIILYGLVSARLEKTRLSAPMVFVAFGLLIGSNGWGLLSLDIESPVLLILAELTLIVVFLPMPTGLVWHLP